MEGKKMRIEYSMFLLAATLAACTTETMPEIVSEPESYTIVVRAAKSDEVAIKALSLDGTTLNATWAAGEEVSIYSLTGEGDTSMESLEPVGKLTARGNGATTSLEGTFSGYTPVAGAKLRLRYLPGPDYKNQKGSLEYIAANCDHATADVTITDVSTDGDVSTTVATFENQQAIVKFSLKNQDGTTPVSATSLTVKVGSRSYDVTPDTPASEIFVAIPAASNKDVTLNVTNASGNFSYEKAGITFEKGKYYALGVKMTKIATLGELYYSDGTFSKTLEAGKTPIGVIAYLGTDAFSENGVTLRDGTTSLQSHGLVLCLKDISNVVWRRRGMTIVIDMTSEPFVDDTGNLTRTNNVSGYANTKFLAEKTDAETDYPAAYQAWNYDLSAPASTTGWFMPSIQQWVKILTTLGGMNASDVVWQEWKDTRLDSIHNLEAAMAKAGDKGSAFYGMSDSNRRYWSSSESTAGGAATLALFPVADGGNHGLMFSYANKINYWNYYVRPVLAF